MSDLRTAALRALEALEKSSPQGFYSCKCMASQHWPHCYWKQHQDAITALRAALAEPETCTWQQDGDSDSGVYGTSCGHYFDITDGTPEDNKMKWCCYCGRKLTQALITEDEDE